MTDKDNKANQRLLITGATGTLGTALLNSISKARLSNVDVVIVVRSEEIKQSYVAQGYGAIVWDIADDSKLPDAIVQLGKAEKTVAVHIAANVSWHHTLEQMRPTNVNGTRNLAELVRSTSEVAQFIYVSSAYTSPINWDYRNAYEQTKAEGESLLRTEFPDLSPSVFSCSLVVGRSDNGEISRFHGIYPLLYVIDFLHPPALSGESSCRLDIVPIDWVSEELLAMIQNAIENRGVEDVVASMGPDSPTFPELVSILVTELNNCRSAQNMEALEPLTVIPIRRWHFLKSAMKNWDVDGLPKATLRTLTHLMESYEPYVTRDHALVPKNVSSPAPDPKDYLNKVIQFWFEKRDSLLRS